MKLFIIAKIVRSRKRNRLFVCSIFMFLLILMSGLKVRNFTHNCAVEPNQLSSDEGAQHAPGSGRIGDGEERV